MAPVLRPVLLPVLEPVLSRRPRVASLSDANAWIAAVEAAEGSPMPDANKTAVRNLIADLKADPSSNPGVSQWQAIQWMHLLAGPNSLTGIQVPLKGVAGTFNNYISGNYSRTTGLLNSVASTTWINSNRAGNADAQNNFSLGVYLTTTPSLANQGMFGNATSAGSVRMASASTNTWTTRAKSASASAAGVLAGSLGIIGVSRNASGNFDRRENNTVTNVAVASDGNNSAIIAFFVLSTASGNPTDARAAMCWAGASVNLALLQIRMATYMSALA